MLQSQGDTSGFIFTVTGVDADNGRAISEDVVGPGGVSGGVYNGLVLLTPHGYGHPYYTYLVDKNAQSDDYTTPAVYLKRWGPHCPWEDSDQYGSPASAAYLTKEGDLIYPYKANIDVDGLNSAGRGGGILKYNWNGDLIWLWEIPPAWGWLPHHDICPILGSNAGPYYGDILLVAMRKTPLPSGTSDGIIQIRPDTSYPGGPATLIRTWSAIDHVTDDPSDISGFWSDGPAGTPLNDDWNHFNSVFLSPMDRVYISSRKWNEFYIIQWQFPTPEPSTTPQVNPEGILYRWGNPSMYDSSGGAVSEDYAALDAPHAVSEIPSGYPGERNAILFNNEKNQILEVLNISDPNGVYDPPAWPDPFGPRGPCAACPSVSIVYSLLPDEESGIQSSVFRLKNGNTYITSCIAGKLFEITPAQDIVWSLNLPGAAIKRSNQYATDYLQQISRKTYTRHRFASVSSITYTPANKLPGPMSVGTLKDL